MGNEQNVVVEQHPLAAHAVVDALVRFYGQIIGQYEQRLFMVAARAAEEKLRYERAVKDIDERNEKNFLRTCAAEAEAKQLRVELEQATHLADAALKDTHDSKMEMERLRVNNRARMEELESARETIASYKSRP